MNRAIDILLVEDSEYDAEMTIRAVKKSAMVDNIIHVKDGAEALDFIFGTGKYEGRNTDMKPKVILLDLKMPKLGGVEVLEKIKSNPATKAIPIVVLTSSKESPDIEKCYDLGANSYIVKPVDFETFEKTVMELGLYWMSINQPDTHS